jgi:hypothetical protein
MSLPTLGANASPTFNLYQSQQKALTAAAQGQSGVGGSSTVFDSVLSGVTSPTSASNDDDTSAALYGSTASTVAAPAQSDNGNQSPDEFVSELSSLLSAFG